MCDYSLQAIRTRPAKVDDKLTVCMFGWSTRGFAAPEDRSVAVCLLPGTELSFADEVRKVHSWPWSPPTIRHKTAIFRKVHERNPTVHHDALEFPDGRVILVTLRNWANKPRYFSCRSPTKTNAQASLKLKGHIPRRPAPYRYSLLRKVRKEKVPTEIGTLKFPNLENSELGAG